MSKKFPRIYHLPWSPGISNDDKRLDNKFLSYFLGCRLMITEKLDGSNLCLTREEVFARSHSGAPTHPSFDLAKKMHGEVRHNIAESMSIFGEWCYAVHSIEYDRLPGPYPFFIFGIRDERHGDWLEWDHIENVADKLGVHHVPVLFDGIVEDNFQVLTENLARGRSLFGSEDREGIVIQPFNGLGNDDDFSQCVAKWVKEGHPKDPDEHWMFKPIRKQGFFR